MLVFGELFRAFIFEEIGTSSLQSRAFAGLANGTFVVCLPGSTSACRTAWEKIIRAQLDARTRPCNLATLRPRLKARPDTERPGIALLLRSGRRCRAAPADGPAIRQTLTPPLPAPARPHINEQPSKPGTDAHPKWTT